MKKVIYTVLTGNYDELRQPLAVDASFDYVCFTDRSGQGGVWQLRDIPFAGSDFLRSRYPKILSREVLPEYGLSVYMDANLQITSEEFYRVISAFEGPLGLVEHPSRDCVAEELRYCYLKDKLSTRVARRLAGYYRSSGMPRHWGLFENNLILRRGDEPRMEALERAWWRLMQESASPRDQLCLTPVLRESELVPGLLLGRGLSARNVPYIHYYPHNPSGEERVKGRLDAANLRYHLRLLWRKLNLLWLI